MVPTEDTGSRIGGATQSAPSGVPSTASEEFSKFTIIVRIFGDLSAKGWRGAVVCRGDGLGSGRGELRDSGARAFRATSAG